VPQRAVGRVPWSAYGSVMSYSQSANVLLGCVVTIEGCMDSTAVNYDPAANTDSNTWCVPAVSGCMMPDPASSSSQAMSTSRMHMKDGGSGNFMASATVNTASACTAGRYGCTTTGSINYDAYATIDDGSCLASTNGCLDRSALNFGCSDRSLITQCWSNGMSTETPRVTVHFEDFCLYVVSPPPPPVTAVPADQQDRSVVKWDMMATGTVSDITTTMIDGIKTKAATTAGVGLDLVRVLLNSGSVIITIEIQSSSTVPASAIQAAMQAHMATPEAATAFIAPIVPGVQVLSTPVVSTAVVPVVTPPAPPPSGDDDDNVGAIVGGVVGGLVVLLLCAGGFYMYQRKKKAATYPA